MLIPVHFSVATQFKIDNSSGTAILAGTLLRLTAVGDDSFVAKANATSTVVGVAADSFKLDAAASASGYAADITINSAGDTTRSQNRISDLYKETLASGFMTTYTGVGQFRTDQYDTGVGSWTLGQPLFSTAVGLVTNVDGGGDSIGKLVGKPQAFPSGVPGTDIDGSISLGTLLTFTLNV